MSDHPLSRSQLVDVALPGGSSRFRLTAVDAAAPVALIVPALGVAARSYLRLVAELESLGINSVVLELRGVGESPLRARRGVDWGYLELIDGELAAAWQLARDRFPSAALHWIGHSLGGQLAVLHPARHPLQPTASVILVGAGAPHFRGWSWPASWLVYLFSLATTVSCRVLGVFRGDWLRFGGCQGARLMSEWAGFVRRGRLGALGAEAWDADQALRRVVQPLRAILLRGDHYVPAAATRLLAGMTPAPFREAQLDDIGQPQAPGHFLWMRHPTGVAAQLAAWMREA